MDYLKMAKDLAIAQFKPVQSIKSIESEHAECILVLEKVKEGLEILSNRLRILREFLEDYEKTELSVKHSVNQTPENN